MVNRKFILFDNLFSKYSLQARLFPALLALFPLFITVGVWAPALYNIAAGFLGLATACGVLVALAHVARHRGRAIENQLVEKWGGMPTTIWLRQSDCHLEQETKQRYYRFFEDRVDGWKTPKNDGPEADEIYQSAVRWLLVNTKDFKVFPILTAENISYGFRRNCLGVKPIALIIISVTLLFPVIALWGSFPVELTTSRLPHVASGVTSLLLGLWWLFVVNDRWVRDAGDAFAKAQLEACDRL